MLDSRGFLLLQFVEKCEKFAPYAHADKLWNRQKFWLLVAR